MEFYQVGKIVNTHGICGEVKVIATTDFPEERLSQVINYMLLSKMQARERN